MLAGLVVDDPAHPLFVDEAAVDHVVTGRLFEHGERPFAACIGVCCEDPAPGIVGQCLLQSAQSPAHRLLQLTGVDAQVAQTQPHPVLQSGNPLRCPQLDALCGDPLKVPMYQGADVSRRVSCPVVLNVDGGRPGVGRGDRDGGVCVTCRMPVRGQAPQCSRIHGRAARCRRGWRRQRCEHVPDHGPEFLQQRIGCRLARLSLAVECDVPEQVQASPGTRGGHIQQTRGLEPAFFPVEFSQVAGDRVCRLLRGADRRHQQAGTAVGACAFEPVKQFAAAAARAAAEAGQDYGVEFEALGLVHGHQLDAPIGIAVRRRIQTCQCRIQAREVEQPTGLLVEIEQCEIGPGVGQRLV